MTIYCDGCAKPIDTNEASRTFINKRWFFFCRDCEQSGRRIEVLRNVQAPLPKRYRALKIDGKYRLFITRGY